MAAPAKAQFGVQQTGPYLGLEYGTATGLGQEDVRFTTARIISAILGLLGIISLVIGLIFILIAPLTQVVLIIAPWFTALFIFLIFLDIT